MSCQLNQQICISFMHHFQPICKDIADHRVPVSDVTVYAEQFIRNTKDKLSPELQTELTGLVTELRETYERLLRDSQGWQRESEDTLAALKKDRDETVGDILCWDQEGDSTLD